MVSSTRMLLAAVAASAFLLASLTAAMLVLLSGTEGTAREVLDALFAERLGAVVMVAFVACGFILAITRALHAHFVLAQAQTADEIGGMLSDPTRHLAPRGSSELRAVIDAVNRLAAQASAHESAIEERVRAANRRAEDERNRFATLVAELAQGVVVCNTEGRILLYNHRSRELFSTAEGLDAALTMGLGRSIHAIVDRDLIAYALEKAASAQATSRFVIAVGNGRLLRIDLAPVRHADEDGAAAGAIPDQPAYLLLIDDISTLFDNEARRDELLQGLTQGLRGPLANLRAAAETLRDYPDMEAEQRERFVAVVGEEADLLSGRIKTAADNFAGVVKTRWPLEEMKGTDLVAAIRRRIQARVGLATGIEDVAAELWLKVDGFSLLQAFTYLASRLRDERDCKELRLRLTPDVQGCCLDLVWDGASMNSETAMEWEIDPMSVAAELSPLSVREVIERCGGEIWFQRDRIGQTAYFRCLLPAVAPRTDDNAPAPAAIASRPEFYDFDLFTWTGNDGNLDDMPLARLAYTVFDTETTGLDPGGGDEIIQIGAVRIVNRRLLRQESFDQLIDPLRPLPASSVKVHGITAAMLAGAPPIGRVLPVFRAFVADTVLVAHNAAFDMRFLQLKEAATGVCFDRPVLDTFLLSGVLFPHEEAHGLDTLAARLGVRVVGRHTALGDAIVTAEVFLRQIDLLLQRGIHTLGAARAAAQNTYQARIEY